MTPPTVIRVNPEHIDAGEPDNCEKCPIALAVLEQFGDKLAWIEVSEAEISLHTPGTEYAADPPAEAVEFITRFDNCDPVQPFEFTVEWRAFDYDDLTQLDAS